MLVLAPSELDYKPKKCKRCFYLEKNHKIGPKDFPPPVFSRFDVVQQAYYKDKTNCSVPKTIIKYVPRSIYDDQISSEESLAEFYKVMFDGSKKNTSLFDDLQNNRGMNNSVPTSDPTSDPTSVPTS